MEWGRKVSCGIAVYFMIAAGIYAMHLGEMHGHGPMFSSTTSSEFSSSSSSGTSDCVWGGPNCRRTFGKRETKTFLVRTYVKIEEEAAHGNGKHLAALAGLMGCPASQTASFSQQLHTRYLALFQQKSSLSREKKITRLYEQLQSISCKR